MNKKTKELLHYILEERRGATITEIIKICYLIDLVAKKNIGNQITGLKYYRYSFGPFDKKIYPCLEEMVSDKIIEQNIKYKTGGELVIYTTKEKFPGPHEINTEEMAIIDTLLETLADFGPKALTEMTYNTSPMLKLKATLGGKEGWMESLDLSV